MAVWLFIVYEFYNGKQTSIYTHIHLYAIKLLIVCSFVFLIANSTQALLIWWVLKHMYMYIFTYIYIYMYAPKSKCFPKVQQLWQVTQISTIDSFNYIHTYVFSGGYFRNLWLIFETVTHCLIYLTHLLFRNRFYCVQCWTIFLPWNFFQLNSILCLINYILFGLGFILGFLRISYFRYYFIFYKISQESEAIKLIKCIVVKKLKSKYETKQFFN